MLYSVTARYRQELLKELYSRLTDGSIEAQKPDGAEIVASMSRARVGHDGAVRWSETCYCPTPLEHERETVYDRYFTRLKAVPATGSVEAEGKPFMDLLRSAASR